MLDLLIQFADHIGIVGVFLTLFAYAALSLGKLSSESLSYSLLNFIGSWMIIVSLMVHWNLSSFVIEVAWIMISMIGIYRYISKRRTSSLAS